MPKRAAQIIAKIYYCEKLAFAISRTGVQTAIFGGRLLKISDNVWKTSTDKEYLAQAFTTAVLPFAGDTK